VRDDDDLEITCNCLPLTIFPWDKYKPVRDDVQREVTLEIKQGFVDILDNAINNNAHPHQLIRILIRTERLLAQYTSAQFTELLPFQAEIRMDLDRAFKILRRKIIRDALCCDKNDKALQEIYRQGLKQLDSRDPDTEEHYTAVHDHFRYGTDIFFNLRGRPNEEVAQERRRKRQ
jgi:hypothetical protein